MKEKQTQPYKPRVLFPFVEAGMGHIMPMHSIADAFEKKYGEYCEIIRSRFYQETNEKPLLRFEHNLAAEARKYAKSSVYGYLNMFLMNVFSPWILPKIIMDVYIPGAGKAARRYMQSLAPDMVVSTHWSTGYYAERIKDKPITVQYIPDARVIPLWRYPNDYLLISKQSGRDEAIKKYPRRFNEKNCLWTPFAIREDAFDMPMDKKAQRRALGLDENKCTVTLMDGGYGVGKTLKIVKKLVELDLPLNVIAICGNNEKSKNALSALKTGEKLTLKVEGQCNALTYFAASDVLVGKSGASTVAEATYFGCAIIVSKYATTIERDNAKYYEETVQNALKIFNVDEIAKTLQFWCEDDEELKLLQANAQKVHGEYGSEKTADLLFTFLQEKFPHLREIKV